MSSNHSVNRYSNEELEEFKNLIETKKNKSEEQLNILIQQIDNINESMGNDGDLMDESSSTNDLNMVQTMANRQRTHINDLERALIRVKNKSYGICIVTGELIDKRRLMAVLTTTKSLAAKNEVMTPNASKPIRKPIAAKNSPKSFSRIIKKSDPSSTPKPPTGFNDDDDDDDDIFENDGFNDTEINVDLDINTDIDLD